MQKKNNEHPHKEDHVGTYLNVSIVGIKHKTQICLNCTGENPWLSNYNCTFSNPSEKEIQITN